MKGSQAGVMGNTGSPCGLSQLLVSSAGRKQRRGISRQMHLQKLEVHVFIMLYLIFIIYLFFYFFFYFFNDAKWCKHCYVTYINACTMRPAQTAGTGEKFQHNWVVSGFHELTIRKLRRATTSNSQQTRPCLSSAPCGNAFMSSSLVDNTLECQTCEMNDSCRWLHRL